MIELAEEIPGLANATYRRARLNQRLAATRRRDKEQQPADPGDFLPTQVEFDTETSPGA